MYIFTIRVFLQKILCAYFGVMLADNQLFDMGRSVLKINQQVFIPSGQAYLFSPLLSLQLSLEVGP